MELKGFEDLVNLGRITRTVKVLNHDVLMGTLNSKEYAAAMARVSTGNNEGDKMESLQRELVVASIRNIDGIELSYQDKSAIVAASQLAFSNLLYLEYVALLEEQAKVLDDAKKNSSAVLTR